MKIAITGSGGLLGRFLLNHASNAGHQALPVSFADINTEPFLDQIINRLSAIQDCDIIIHCAASKNPKSHFERFLNVQVPRLIEQYIDQHHLPCRLIHISSVNVVIAQLQDHYTQSKRQAEQLLDPNKTSIVRPGLIWSPPNDPNIQKISAYLQIRHLPHFMFKPGNWYSPIDPESLARLILGRLDNFLACPQTLHILGNRRYSLWQLIKSLADGQNAKLFPIPTAWFQFLPLQFLIKHTSIGELLNQLLPIDRTILPNECKNSLIELPYQEHQKCITPR